MDALLEALFEYIRGHPLFIALCVLCGAGIVVMVLLTSSRDVMWIEETRLHDGRTIDARREADMFWSPMRHLEDAKAIRSAMHEVELHFPTPDGDVRWRARDTGWGEDAGVVPVMFDFHEGVPFVVVRLEGTQTHSLCDRQSWPGTGVAVFAWRDGAWARERDDFVPPDFRLNLDHAHRYVPYIEGGHGGRITAASMVGIDDPRNAPERRLTFAEYKALPGLRYRCDPSGTRVDAAARARGEAMTKAAPDGAPIDAILEVAGRIKSLPGTSSPFFEQAFAGADDAGWAQDGCDPAVRFVEGRGTLATIGGSPARPVDILIPDAASFVTGGFACAGDEMHLLMLPRFVADDSASAHLYRFSRQGELRSFREVRLTGLTHLRQKVGHAGRMHDARIAPKVLAFRHERDALVLMMRADLVGPVVVRSARVLRFRIPLSASSAVRADPAPPPPRA